MSIDPKITRIAIVASGIFVVGFCVWKIGPAKSYNCIKNAAKVLFIAPDWKQQELDRLSKPFKSSLIGESPKFVVVKIVSDPLVGIDRIIAKNPMDPTGVLVSALALPGRSYTMGQTVEAYSACWSGDPIGFLPGSAHFFAPLDDPVLSQKQLIAP